MDIKLLVLLVKNSSVTNIDLKRNGLVLVVKKSDHRNINTLLIKKSNTKIIFINKTKMIQMLKKKRLLIQKMISYLRLGKSQGIINIKTKAMMIAPILMMSYRLKSRGSEEKNESCRESPLLNQSKERIGLKDSLKPNRENFKNYNKNKNK